jgi:hypothetical protein
MIKSLNLNYYYTFHKVKINLIFNNLTNIFIQNTAIIFIFFKKIY